MLAAAVGVALFAASAAAAGPDATASLSTRAAGARHVALTIVLRAEDLQCGRLKATSLVVALPRTMRVPRSIAAKDALVSGREVASVQTKGSTITLVPAPARGVICDSIGPGSVRIELTRGAGLGNPRRAGTYGFAVRPTPRGIAWHGSFVVTR